MDFQKQKPLKEPKPEPLDEDLKELLWDINNFIVPPSNPSDQNPHIDWPQGRKEVPIQCLTRKCSICSKMKSHRQLKEIKFEGEKLVIAIGFSIGAKISFEDAKRIISMSNDIYSCVDHLGESIDIFCKSLNIQNISEIDSVTPREIITFMDTIKSMIPSIEISDMVNMIKFFTMINEKFVIVPKKEEEEENETSTSSESSSQIDQKPNLTDIQERKIFEIIAAGFPPNRTRFCPLRGRTAPARRRCLLCSKSDIRSYFTEVTSQNTKMILILGFYLKGKLTMTQAQFYCSRTSPIFTCPTHFLESLQEIYSNLDIREFSELSTSSKSLMYLMMKIVNNLNSGMKIDEFKDALFRYYLSYQFPKNLRSPKTE